MGQRLDLLLGSRQQLQELRTLVRDFEKALNNDPKAKAHSTETIRALLNKRNGLDREIRHADKLIAQCKEALEAEDHASSESVSSDSENALDLNGLSRFAQGDTEVFVRSLYEPLLELATEYNDLEEEATNSPPGTFDWTLAAEGIVSCLDRMEDLLRGHVLNYRGRDHGFVQWVSDKREALQLERLVWQRELSRYNS